MALELRHKSSNNLFRIKASRSNLILCLVLIRGVTSIDFLLLKLSTDRPLFPPRSAILKTFSAIPTHTIILLIVRNLYLRTITIPIHPRLLIDAILTNRGSCRSPGMPCMNGRHRSTKPLGEDLQRLVMTSQSRMALSPSMMPH
jgi:hypothetical protein